VGCWAAGVSWHSREEQWRAAINIVSCDGKSKLRNLGSFVNEVDAALAYDQAARKHYKNKAQLNFPDLNPPSPPPQATSQYRGEGQVHIGPWDICLETRTAVEICSMPRCLWTCDPVGPTTRSEPHMILILSGGWGCRGLLECTIKGVARQDQLQHWRRRAKG
jgi:hypothetical protein